MTRVGFEHTSQQDFPLLHAGFWFYLLFGPEDSSEKSDDFHRVTWSRRQNASELINICYKTYRLFILQAYYTSITSYRHTLISPGKLNASYSVIT
jgi:hypothetical protein